MPKHFDDVCYIPLPNTYVIQSCFQLQSNCLTVMLCDHQVPQKAVDVSKFVHTEDEILCREYQELLESFPADFQCNFKC